MESYLKKAVREERLLEHPSGFAQKTIPAVLPVTAEILHRARILLDEYDGLMARDALHAAVVEINSLEAICSYDSDFDRITTIVRTEPP